MRRKLGGTGSSGDGSRMDGGGGGSAAGVLRRLGFFLRWLEEARDSRGGLAARDAGCLAGVIRGGGRARGLMSGTGGRAGGSSEHRWEPGSARVPTFCVLFCPPGRANGDGDLPLPGDGGGEPKRELVSKSSCSPATSSTCMSRGPDAFRYLSVLSSRI